MKNQKLRVWWIPQIPMKPFIVEVSDLQTASTLLDVLAKYDSFQFENNIKQDYANTGGLSVFEDGEWTDWYSEDGEEFDEYREKYLIKTKFAVKM